MQLSGSDYTEVIQLTNRVLSGAVKLLKICMEDPIPENATIAFNNLQTLRWAIDQIEKHKQTPGSFVAIIKYIDDIHDFANQILEDTNAEESKYLELIVELRNKNAISTV